MPPLEDPDLLARFRAVLENWRFAGYVAWNERATIWVKENLEEFTLRDLARLMWEHIEMGNPIYQVPERRAEWNMYDFHYDFRFRVNGRRIYIETILLDDDPDDPTIQVVSVHDA